MINVLQLPWIVPIAVIAGAAVVALLVVAAQE